MFKYQLSVTKCYTMKDDVTHSVTYVYDATTDIDGAIRGWLDAGYIINSLKELT